jgi:hypothetical protein
MVLGRTAAPQGFGSWRHLAARFFGALSPAGPSAEDEGWAIGSLLEGERALWRRMSGPDRRHAVGVAREVARVLGPDEVPRPAVAAALMHDVGKVESSLGTFARVGVTFAAMAMGRERLVRWAGGAARQKGRSWRARTGLYLAHDRVGAQLLEDAGSDALTVAWAGEHHLGPERWTVETGLGAALKAADGD